MYELWDLVSRNLIDWFHDRREAALAVQAYADANKLGEIVLLVHEHGDAHATGHSLTGDELRSWLRTGQAEAQ